jgi:hypothetical protein
MLASNIARVIVGILENPEKRTGATYQLHGRVEYSHREIAGVLSKDIATTCFLGPERSGNCTPPLEFRGLPLSVLPVVPPFRFT